MKKRPLIYRPAGANYEIRVVGHRPQPLRDFYHGLMRLNWPSTFGVICIGFLIANALFAFAYFETDGVVNADPHSFADAFYFSVQTMGTVGYGAMYPRSTAANICVVVEVIVGLTLTALATGLVFAKFSRPTARVVFSRTVTISPMDGIPTMMFRMGNERGNSIVDTHLNVVLSRTERTVEGKMYYRLYDLKLVRDHALSLNRSLSLMHRIDDTSPFYRMTPEAMIEQEIELQVMVVGLDDTAMQTVHATHNYYAHEILWGAHFVDVLSENEDGSLTLNLNNFHETEPSVPTDAFPYPRA